MPKVDRAITLGDAPLAARALAALQPKAEGSGYFSLEQPFRSAACEARIAEDAAGAVACLEALLSDRAYYQTHVALLRAYVAAGQDEKALATARWLIDHRGLATAEWLGEFSGRAMNLIAADEALVEAATFERKADRAAAADELLTRFRTAWSNREGDPPLWQRSLALAPSGAERKKR